MSGASKCNICGISGTSTYKCCGNNKEFRITQISKEIETIDNQIEMLKQKKIELIIEKVQIEHED